MEQFHFIKLSLQLRFKSMSHLPRWKWHNYVLSRVYKSQTNSKGQWIRKVAFFRLSFSKVIGCPVAWQPTLNTQVTLEILLSWFRDTSHTHASGFTPSLENIFSSFIFELCRLSADLLFREQHPLLPSIRSSQRKAAHSTPHITKRDSC